MARIEWRLDLASAVTCALYDFCNVVGSPGCSIDASAARVNRRHITATRYLSGPAVEAALAGTLPMIGVDPLMAAASAIHLPLDPAAWQPNHRSPTLRQDVRDRYRAMLRGEHVPIGGELAAAAAETLAIELP